MWDLGLWNMYVFSHSGIIVPTPYVSMINLKVHNIFRVPSNRCSVFSWRSSENSKLSIDD